MNWRTRGWATAHVVVVAGFLLSVASSYHRDTGFTRFIEFSSDRHGTTELARVRESPHDDGSAAGYDGQFYAQLAVDPLLRDPAIDNALDVPAYRARRILFSWTAYALGFGRPAWVLHAYALQNVIAWLILAWLLLRWFPIGTSRNFALWCGCLLTQGLIASVKLALLDGPSVLVIAVAVVSAERGSLWWTAILTGLAGLARETNLLAATLLARFLDRSPRSWLRVGLAALVAVLPLALWLDYVRSIYLSSTFAASVEPVGVPVSGLLWKWHVIRTQAWRAGWDEASIASALVIAAFLVQGAYVTWRALRSWGSPVRDSPWVPIALSFFMLGLVAGTSVWEGTPGAIARVTLPLAFGFNVAARDAPWPVFLLGNLTVVQGLAMLTGLV